MPEKRTSVWGHDQVKKNSLGSFIEQKLLPMVYWHFCAWYDFENRMFAMVNNPGAVHTG